MNWILIFLIVQNGQPNAVALNEYKSAQACMEEAPYYAQAINLERFKDPVALICTEKLYSVS